MKNKKSVLMTLNHNYGCFSTVAGIAGNVQGIGEEADLTAQKMIEAQMFNQPIQRHSSTSAAFLPMPCYMPLRFNSRNF